MLIHDVRGAQRQRRSIISNEKATVVGIEVNQRGANCGNVSHSQSHRACCISSSSELACGIECYRVRTGGSARHRSMRKEIVQHGR